MPKNTKKPFKFKTIKVPKNLKWATVLIDFKKIDINKLKKEGINIYNGYIKINGKKNKQNSFRKCD